MRLYNPTLKSLVKGMIQPLSFKNMVRFILGVSFTFTGLSSWNNAYCADAEESAIQSPTQRALFVGNSFSYFNDGLHNHVANLVRASKQWQRGKTRFRLKTISGGRLAEHVPGLSVLLDGQGYEAVVIQGFSNGPLQTRSAQAFYDNVAKLVKITRQHNAQPMLFMTWPYANAPEMTAPLQAAYEKAGAAHNAKVIPVGLAFAQVLADHPEINLYVQDFRGINDDGSIRYANNIKHPSVAGTYLTACVFYAAFYQQSPQGNPYKAGLTPTIANQLQMIAWQVTRQYFNEPL